MVRIQYEIDDLLLPIANSNNGVGKDCHLSNTYDEIRNARTAEDARLSMGVWEHDPKKADWPLVESLTVDVLKEESKDLLVVSWLMEALINLDGFNGAIKAFQILEKFVQTFTTTCFPHLEDGTSDTEQKYQIMNKFITNSTSQFMLIPFVENYTLYEYDYATETKLKIKQSPDQEASIMEVFRKEKRPDVDTIQNAIKNAKNIDEKIAILNNVDIAISSAFSAFSNVYEDVVSFSNCSSIIKQIIGILRKFKIDEVDKEAEQQSQPSNRDAIYAQLMDIAINLKSIEKHSPTPYILDMLISWKDKTLYQIIQELHESNSEQNKLLKFLLQ